MKKLYIYNDLITKLKKIAFSKFEIFVITNEIHYSMLLKIINIILRIYLKVLVVLIL